MAKLIKYIKLKKSSSCSRYSSFFSFAMSSYTFFSSSGSPQAMAKGPPCRSQVRQHSRYELCCANPCAKEQNHEHTMTHYIRHVFIYIYIRYIYIYIFHYIYIYIHYIYIYIYIFIIYIYIHYIYIYIYIHYIYIYSLYIYIHYIYIHYIYIYIYIHYIYIHIYISQNLGKAPVELTCLNYFPPRS